MFRLPPQDYEDQTFEEKNPKLKSSPMFKEEDS